MIWRHDFRYNKKYLFFTIRAEPLLPGPHLGHDICLLLGDPAAFWVVPLFALITLEHIGPLFQLLTFGAEPQVNHWLRGQFLPFNNPVIQLL